MRKKCILWSVLLLQACFIACFWLIQQADSRYAIAAAFGHQQHHNVKVPPPSHDTEDAASTINDNTTSNQLQALSVHFVKSEAADDDEPSAKERIGANGNAQPVVVSNRRCENVNSFTRDFRELQHSDKRLIDSGGVKWCFLDGTANMPTNETADSGGSMNAVQGCICRPQWHGSDCSQPEVVWRALMATRRTFAWLKPTMAVTPHRLTLLVEGNFLSEELLELQLHILADVVDDIVILVRRMDVQLHELRAIERKLIQRATTGSDGNYMIIHCTNGSRSNSGSSRRHWKIRVASIYGNCTALRAHEKYRQLCPLRHIATDLFLYAQEFDLLSPQALKFFKYYGGADMPIMRFRLKYNVYGFYWQHPERTHLSALLSSFAQLHHPRLGMGDPQRLLQLTQVARKPTDDTSLSVVVIGDLNHFGGWYCLYCQQPAEIIAHLQAGHHSSSHIMHVMPNVQLPNGTRNNHIDITYVQKLIANGIYLNDGRTPLRKLYYHLEASFAPKYVARDAWKFSHLLVNIYESFDDVASYDEEIY